MNKLYTANRIEKIVSNIEFAHCTNRIVYTYRKSIGGNARYERIVEGAALICWT